MTTTADTTTATDTTATASPGERFARAFAEDPEKAEVRFEYTITDSFQPGKDRPRLTARNLFKKQRVTSETVRSWFETRPDAPHASGGLRESAYRFEAATYEPFVAPDKPVSPEVTNCGVADATAEQRWTQSTSESNSIEVSAEVGAGRISITVPSDVTIELHTKLGMGVVQLDGRDVSEGFRQDDDRTLMPIDEGGDGGTIVLDLEVGFGQIEINRTN